MAVTEEECWKYVSPIQDIRWAGWMNPKLTYSSANAHMSRVRKGPTGRRGLAPWEAYRLRGRLLPVAGLANCSIAHSPMLRVGA